MDGRRIGHLRQRLDRKPRAGGSDLPGILVEVVAVAAQRQPKLSDERWTPPVQQTLRYTKKPADMPGVGPVHRLEVGLRGLPSSAAVLVGAVEIRGKFLVLERSGDLSKSAGGHEIPEDPACRPADQSQPRDVEAVEESVVRPPIRATARYTVERVTLNSSSSSAMVCPPDR